MCFRVVVRKWIFYWGGCHGFGGLVIKGTMQSDPRRIGGPQNLPPPAPTLSFDTVEPCSFCSALCTLTTQLQDVAPSFFGLRYISGHRFCTWVLC